MKCDVIVNDICKTDVVKWFRGTSVVNDIFVMNYYCLYCQDISRSASGTIFAVVCGSGSFI